MCSYSLKTFQHQNIFLLLNLFPETPFIFTFPHIFHVMLLAVKMLYFTDMHKELATP